MPDGAYGSLRGSLVLMTSHLCAREIFGEDRQEIGFSPASGDMVEIEKARIFNLCCTAVERLWGTDFLGHLDDLIIFHRLREPHLPLVLQRFLDELNRQLAHERIRVELDAAATRFLLERSARFLQHGAWYVGKVFRRFVLFPVADLAASEQLPPESRVSAELDGERLRFSVTAEAPEARPPMSREGGLVDIPIAWDDGPVVAGGSR
jgi:ATP-dependent Clp protease ATP-binding subunit ClpA